MNIPVKEDYNDELMAEIAGIEAQETEVRNERKEELDWIVEQLCGMSDENFKEFIRSVRYQRKADARRRRMTPNA